MSNTAELSALIDDLMAEHPGEQAPGSLPEAWPALVELGLVDAGIAEEAGGSGGTIADVAAVAQALGRHAVSSPLIEANAAHWALAQSRERVGGLAVATVTDARLGGRDPALPATLPAVPWARSAQVLVAFGPDGCWALDLAGPGVTVEPGANVAGDPRDTVRLDRAPRRLDFPHDADLLRARLGVLWSAAICGAALGAYELTRRYVKEREQFGQPLIKIPAVAGSLGTMRVQVLQAEAALARAVDRWDPAAGARTMEAAAVARLTAAVAGGEVARLAHQLHGAIGITSEYPLHRLTRRLWAWRDAEIAEHTWALLLGNAVIRGGEQALWEEISAQ